MLESDFQREFLLRVRARLLSLGHVDVVRNETHRSIPDIVLLGPNGRWAALEFKRSKVAKKQPNQEFHVQRLNEKGYAAFVYPENGEEILRELEEVFSKP